MRNNVIISRINLIDNFPSLPKDEPPEPWGSTLRSIQNCFIYPSLLPYVEIPSIKMALLIIETNWAYYINYVYQQKWNKKFKTGHKSKNTELFGEYLFAILEMCIQIHTIHPMGYTNASQWFDKICWEMKYIERENIIIDGGIKNFITEYRNIALNLKAVMSIGNLKNQIHFIRLLDAVREINDSNITPDIIKDYWKEKFYDSKGIEHNGVIRSLTKYITFLDREGIDTFSIDKENRLYMQNGKGKSRILIPDKCIKSALNQLCEYE